MTDPMLTERLRSFGDDLNAVAAPVDTQKYDAIPELQARLLETFKVVVAALRQRYEQPGSGADTDSVWDFAATTFEQNLTALVSAVYQRDSEEVGLRTRLLREEFDAMASDLQRDAPGS